jgi:hypothetical protein
MELRLFNFEFKIFYKFKLNLQIVNNLNSKAKFFNFRLKNKFKK